MTSFDYFYFWNGKCPADVKQVNIANPVQPNFVKLKHEDEIISPKRSDGTLRGGDYHTCAIIQFLYAF